MSESSTPESSIRWLTPMVPRDNNEPGRTSTPLELFFDLVFVVAIARASSSLHHAVVANQTGAALLSYAMVFFAIWWAWMNFTWFASAYDVDDVVYRLAVFVQLAGALIIAAGMTRAFEERDFTIVTIGYVIMRLVLVMQWLRAARSDPLRRKTALRYASGVSACQLCWIAFILWIPAGVFVPFGFFVLATAELLVPIWAESISPTPWHAGHIAERYGLFTIIVLGESIAAASMAIQLVTAESGFNFDFAIVIGSGLVIVLSMWWIYFERPMEEMLTSFRVALIWGYGHLIVFASAAAVGAGIAVRVDQVAGSTDIGEVGASASVTIPVSVFMLSLWALHGPLRSRRWFESVLPPAIALLIVLVPLTGQGIPLTALLISGLLMLKLTYQIRAHPEAECHS